MARCRCNATASSKEPSGQLRFCLDNGVCTGRLQARGSILKPVTPRWELAMPTRPLGHHSVRQPIRLLHLLDGLLTQASLTAKSSGVNQRRQRQRLELTQRLLDPLPEQLAPRLSPGGAVLARAALGHRRFAPGLDSEALARFSGRPDPSHEMALGRDALKARLGKTSSDVI